MDEGTDGRVDRPDAGPMPGPAFSASPVTGRRRRLLVWETVLVLGVSLGSSAWYSVLSIVDLLTRHVRLSTQTSSLNVSVTPDRPWLDLAYQLTDIVLPLVPVALAGYLLATVHRPENGVLRAVGLAPRRLGRDAAWGVALAACIGIPGLGLYLGARAIGINTTVQAANLTDHWWTIPVLLLSAAMNAVLEESVMIGYLFTRWRQAGGRWVTVILVSALIRGSYHLYQGFGGFAGNLIMGAVFGEFARRTRRVLPLVITHFLLDAVSFVGYSLLHGHVSWL